MTIIAKLKKLNCIKALYKKLFTLVGKFPADQKLVVFESFLGKQYSCNPRAIYEYMLEHKPEYKMYWSVDKRFNQQFEDLNIPYINRFSIKWLFVMARAKYWVTNSRMPLWIPKPKHTTYLQTWHGTPLKKLAMDMDEVHMPGTNTEKYKRNFYTESRNWDYLISPNAYSSEIFKRAFQFEKKMIESGYPRNDILHADNKQLLAHQIKIKLGLPADKKIILYAPTWRDNQYYSKGKYKFDLELDLKRMQQEFGEDYIILLRMHYLVAENLDLSAYQGFAYDFSYHGDIKELYLISDLLITDYSSVFFDYANLKRPIIFFVYDIESYRDELRGFYFELEAAAPGPLVRTTDEVINMIKETEKNTVLPANYEEFYEKFCDWENGSSAKKVVDTVFS